MKLILDLCRLVALSMVLTLMYLIKFSRKILIFIIELIDRVMTIRSNSIEEEIGKTKTLLFTNFKSFFGKIGS